MSLTPVEIRHAKLGRALLGYDRRSTDRLLEEIAASFEAVWRDRADFQEEIERLEGELARFREQEALLRRTLVSAERASDDLRSRAHREADLILDEARAQARDIARGAEGERERVETEIRRLKALESEVRSGLRAFVLSTLDRMDSETEPAEAAAQPV